MNKKKNRLEHTIKTHSHEIFACGEPKDGHRERFARRLEALHAATTSEVGTDTHLTHETKANNRRNRMWRILTGVVTTAAAVMAGIWLFTSRPEMTAPLSSEDSPADVQNHYAMLFENELETTKQLLSLMDGNERAKVLEELETMEAEQMPEVQMTDEHKITLIVSVYSSRITALQQIQMNLITHQIKAS